MAELGGSEMEPIKIVARCTNGTVIKGFTQDFSPNKDRFHVIPVDKRSGGTNQFSFSLQICIKNRQ